MRVLVCGSRHYNDSESLFAVLDELHAQTTITDIISGCAKGADTLAIDWCMSRRRDDDRLIRLWEYPADWKQHGKAAGPIRNTQMLVDGRPDLVVAFLAPDSRGTANMIAQTEKAGVPVKVINV